MMWMGQSDCDFGLLKGLPVVCSGSVAEPGWPWGQEFGECSFGIGSLQDWEQAAAIVKGLVRGVLELNDDGP